MWFFTYGMINLTGTQNPMGMGTDTKFYMRVWVRVQISTRSLFADGRVIVLSDPTLCHP
jgi:hypothetical protein